MADQIKLYEGEEAELAFVPRYAAADTDSRCWRYCVDRHKGRWASEKKRRRVPIYQFEGQIGWWFPALWVADYASMEAAIDRRNQAA